MAIPELMRKARRLLEQKEARVLPRAERLKKASAESSADAFFSGLVEGAFLVAAADGEMSDDEEGTLSDTLRHLTGDAMEPEEFVAMIEAFEGALHEDGFDGRVKALAGSLPDEAARREVLGFAVLVALCDRHLADAEWKSLIAMAQAFGFDKAEVESIVATVEEALKDVPVSRKS